MTSTLKQSQSCVSFSLFNLICFSWQFIALYVSTLWHICSVVRLLFFSNYGILCSVKFIFLLHLNSCFSLFFHQTKDKLYLFMVLTTDDVTRPRALTNALPLNWRTPNAHSRLAKLLRGTVACSLKHDCYVFEHLHLVYCFKPFKSCCCVSTDVMGETAANSEWATHCLETPVSVFISTWKWLTYVNVSCRINIMSWSQKIFLHMISDP